jgi:hypothetical protein
MVLHAFKDTATGNWISYCGGALIREDVVLTGANCKVTLKDLMVPGTCPAAGLYVRTFTSPTAGTSSPASPQTLLPLPRVVSMPYALCFDSCSHAFPSAGAYYSENGPSGQAGLTSKGIQPRAVINHPEYNSAPIYYAFDASLVFLKTCVDKSVSPITVATSEGEPERSGSRSERGCQLCRSRHIIAHAPASCARHLLVNRTFNCCDIRC